MAMTMKVELVTPQKAAEYLRKNVDNYRKITKSKAAQYAEEMKAGKWQLNGEPIVFDVAGKLKNGQHRLAAILIAQVPVKLTIINGVDEDVVIYDSGMNRSTKQMAVAAGCGDVSATEAAVAAAVVGKFKNRAPKGIVLEWLKDNYVEVSRAYRLCGASNRRNLSCRVGCVLAAYMLLQAEEIRSYEMEVFFKVFNTGNVIGTDGYEPSSALVARRMFEERYKAMPNDQKRLMEQVEILIMALRDFKKGKTRQMNYQVREPMACVEMIEALCGKDEEAGA